MWSRSFFFFFVVFLSLLLASFSSASDLGFPHDDAVVSPEITTEMMPDKGEMAVRMMMTATTNENRRRLGSFQICSACTCCGAKGYCLLSPCCYAINCNLPNRPFGFCSFTPKACNCFGCHL